MVHNLQNVGMGSPVISRSLPPQHGASSGCRCRNGLQCGSPAWGLGKVLTTPHRKNVTCYEMLIQKASDLDGYFVMT
jgi:hypothetical protein